MKTELPPITPWGAIHTKDETVEGLVFISTASHGGYYVTPELWAILLAKFPGFIPFAGEGWLEEDVDWSMVPLAFPELFGDEVIRDAVTTAKGWIKNIVVPAELLARAEAFERRLATLGMWERGGLSTGGKIWNVSFTNVATGERRVVAMKDYPAKRHYAAAELDTLAA